jgi:DNA sulfur modification protein DndD
MLIKQLELNNFLCYKGSNIIEFTKGCNIITGKNKSGKSKIFDGFKFLLEDCVYVQKYKSQDKLYKKEFIPIAEYGFNVINYSAAHDAKKDEIVKCFVKLILEHNNQIWTITREYTNMKTCVSNYKDGEALYLSKDSWRPIYATTLKLVIENKSGEHVKSLSSGNTSDLNEILKELENVFKKSIRSYYLMQGEQFDQLMNLEGTFLNAIKSVAKVEILDSLKIITSEILKNIFDRKRKHISTSSKFDKKFKDSNDTITKYKTEVENINIIFLPEVNNAIDEDEVDVEKIDEEITNKQGLNAIVGQLNSIEEKISNSNTSLEKLNKDRHEILQKDALIVGLNQNLSQFFNKYHIMVENGKIPELVGMKLIEKILKTEKCICDRALTPDSKIEIEKYKEHKDLSHDITAFISLAGRYEAYERRELNVIKELLNINNRIGKEIDQNAMLKKEKSECEAKLPEGTSQNEASNYASLFADRDFLQGRITKSKKEKKGYETVIESLSRKIEEEEKKLDKMRKTQAKDTELDALEKEYLLADNLNNIINKGSEITLNDIFYKVEELSNEMFTELTKNSKSLKGELIINRDDNIIENKQFGRTVPSDNEGHISIGQFAIITALMKYAFEKFGEEIPFITDAPVSKLDEDNERDAIRVFNNNLHQSIIIIKSSTGENTLTDFKMSGFYKFLSEEGIKNIHFLKLEVDESYKEKNDVNLQNTIIEKV